MMGHRCDRKPLKIVLCCWVHGFICYCFDHLYHYCFIVFMVLYIFIIIEVLIVFIVRDLIVVIVIVFADIIVD